MTPAEALTEVTAAVQARNHHRVTELCKEIAADARLRSEPFPETEARKILESLKSMRHFDEMTVVGRAFIRTKQQAPKIRKLYAQGLIDSGDLAAAEEFLETMLQDEDVRGQKKEYREAWGLLGRVNKQSYVDSSLEPAEKALFLKRAVEAYDEIYAADDEQWWHGINVVACLARAEADGIPIDHDPSVEEMARNILGAIDEAHADSEASLWDFATAMEAAVALDQEEEAVRWAELYVKAAVAKGESEFEYGSTRRQLEQVWGVTSEHFAGRSIIPMLTRAEVEQAFSDQGSGRVTLSADTIRGVASEEVAPQLERVFGDADFRPLSWLTRFVNRALGVGIVRDQTRSQSGTGFVVRGKDLADSLEDDWYFLTNCHVLTDLGEVHDAAPVGEEPIRPEDAKIVFEALNETESRSFGVEKVVWSSPPGALDATLVKLDAPFYEDEVDPYPVRPKLPRPGRKARVYIAGHPGGQSLVLSIHDNHLIQHNDRLMHYRTPTNPGSSGSPVFNDRLDLVGVHHAGDGRMKALDGSGEIYEANEGIRLSAIIEAIRAHLAE